MDITSFTIRVLIVLMPGLIAAVLVEQLTVHPKWEQFRFAVYSLILGCVTYVLYQIGINIYLWVVAYIGGTKYQLQNLSFWYCMSDTEASIKPAELFIACCISVILGMALVGLVQHKWLHRISKRIGISDKYGDENLYTYFMNSPQTTWLWIRDRENNIIYEGLKSALSESESVCEVVLTDVRVYHAVTQEKLYEIPAIYLSYAPGTLSIEMANLEEIADDCTQANNA